MATFPTIYRHGTVIHTPVAMELPNEYARDPSIKTKMEGGYDVSRARFTRLTRKWNVHYTWVTQANKNTIRAFEDARYGGAGYFTWTNPEDGVEYTVRFLGNVVYTPHDNVNFLWWEITFVLEQM